MIIECMRHLYLKKVKHIQKKKIVSDDRTLQPREIFLTIRYRSSVSLQRIPLEHSQMYKGPNNV